jgi:hypothetical protein
VGPYQAAQVQVVSYHQLPYLDDDLKIKIAHYYICPCYDTYIYIVYIIIYILIKLINNNKYICPHIINVEMDVLEQTDTAY